MLRPLNDRVVITIDKPSEKTIAGIILPESAQRQQKISQGRVMAVGPGRLTNDGKLLPMTVKPGDRVLFSWGGNDVEVGKDEYRIMTEGDILAVLE